jgi:hypothetical protein
VTRGEPIDSGPRPEDRDHLAPSPASPSSAGSRAVVVGTIVLATLGALAIRVVVEGRTALAEADEAAAAGRTDDAIAGWETAARWYLPLAPHVDEAYARLIELATRSGARGLPAWRAVRSAALATRHLWTPHPEHLAAANTAIAELASRDPHGAAAAGADAETRRRFHAERLARDPRPATGAVVLAIAGIAAWLAGIGIAIRRGIDETGRPSRRPALVGAALTVAGLAGWAVGLYNA